MEHKASRRQERIRTMEAPKEIWIGCIGGKLVRGLLGFGYSCRKEKIWKNDVKYIRADIHEAYIKEIERVEKEIKKRLSLQKRRKTLKRAYLYGWEAAMVECGEI